MGDFGRIIQLVILPPVYHEYVREMQMFVARRRRERRYLILAVICVIDRQGPQFMVHCTQCFGHRILQFVVPTGLAPSVFWGR